MTQSGHCEDLIHRSRKLAATLMLLSGLTHISQLAVYGVENHIVGAALFGLAYLIIGALLLSRSNIGLWLGAIIPSIGMVGGVYRLVAIQVNPFTLFHLPISLSVVAICLYWLVQNRGVSDHAE